MSRRALRIAILSLASFFLTLLTCKSLPAQRCGGRVNLRVFAPGQARMQSFGTTQGTAGSVKTISNDSYQVKCRGNTDASLRQVNAGNLEFLTLDYGCSATEKITIHRCGRPGRMTIIFDNLCDADFGLDIQYRKGRYHLNVCEPGRKVSLREKYPGIINGGMDITPVKWKRGKH